ncbi:MAG: glycoside hydrolase family 43 protein [Bacillota bacterium]|nr:glycoside hydrolase family 43 protein [Bacillota bacterium]
MKYKNPIIPGFYPDPSICRAGEDYYLVTSSFCYFPGVPIFHSTDLVNWKQIGHCLTTASQLPLGKTWRSAGIYAPTIRYHDGLFYMVTTNVSSGGNFYVYTDNPSGKWSEPLWVDQGGIDPSLLFDEDGRVYFTSTTQYGTPTPGICLSEIDIKTGKRLTEVKYIWGGNGGRHPEAPHLYKISNYYYLMIAEGGTEYGHMVTHARSRSPWGPFESCPGNPILTHRNSGFSTIQGTGHADIVEDGNGNWWMVFLAFRTANGDYHHLGRETFLAPLEWNKEGWPIVNGNGTVQLTVETDKITSEQIQMEVFEDNFDDATLDYRWNYVRNPNESLYSLTEKKGCLRLYGSEVSLNDVDSPAFVGKRQQHFNCSVETLLDFKPEKKDEEAGLTVIMDEKHHYEIAVTGDGPGRKVIVRRTIGKLSVIVAEEAINAGSITLEISAETGSYHFKYAVNGNIPKEIADGETKYLSSEVAGGFTGVYFGLYATGNGRKNSIPADFHYFKYTEV